MKFPVRCSRPPLRSLCLHSDNHSADERQQQSAHAIPGNFSPMKNRASNAVHAGTVAMMRPVLPTVVRSIPSRKSTWYKTATTNR
jgi:hypothetical protein